MMTHAALAGDGGVRSRARRAISGRINGF